jgi:hypothetical protein
MIYNSQRFWEETTYTAFGAYDTFAERLDKYYRQLTIEK